MHTIPYVIEETGRGERVLDIFSRLFKERIIFIHSSIDVGVASAVIAQLLVLCADSPTQEISMYLQSSGGSITAGLAIRDTMKFVGCPIATYAIGNVGGVATALLAAGSKGRRHALPNARIMMHQPVASIGGSATDLRLQAKEVSTLKRMIAGVFSESTGKTEDEIMWAFDREFFLGAKEAIAFGLVDREASKPDKLGKDSKDSSISE